MKEIVLSNRKNGMAMMFLFIILYLAAFFCIVFGASNGGWTFLLMIVGILWCVVMMVSQGTIDAEPYWLLCFGPAISGLIVQVIVSLATQKSDPPVPLCHRDGTPIKWPELGENRYIVE